MKRTLLEIVQEILSEMSSDDVNSINDTIESQQVANVVKSCYNELISNRNWPHLKKLTQLDSSGTLSQPVFLKMPDNLREMLLVKYDCRKEASDKKEYKEIKYLHPDEFLSYVNKRDSLKSNVRTISGNGVDLLIVDDKAPDFYTSFDDVYIVFDSFNKNVDDTLKNSKTQILAYIEPSWVHDDAAVPDLPADAFALLIEESKSVAFLTVKQVANQKAEQRAMRQNRWLSRKAWRAHGGIRYENYGRK